MQEILLRIFDLIKELFTKLFEAIYDSEVPTTVAEEKTPDIPA